MFKSITANIARYASLYVALWKNSVVREMGFKANFLLWIFVELLWFGLQMTLVAVIYRHTDSIGDWTQYEVILLVAVNQLLQQLITALFLGNCSQLSEYIRTGKLDFMLLLPVNTRFLVSFRLVDLGGFVNAASALAVMAYAIKQLGLTLQAGQILLFTVLILAGLLMHYSLLLALASSAFWTVRSQGVVWGYYNLLNIARMPDAAFQGGFRAFFTFVLPILLVSNVPAKVLAAKLHSWSDAFLLLALAFILFGISELVWRVSVRQYTSASS